MHLVDHVKLKSSWARTVKLCELPFLSAVTNFENIQLSVSEIERCKFLWIYLHQKHYISQVIFKIAFKRLLKGGKKSVRLEPILKDVLLKVGGRLAHAILDEDEKHPFILADKDPFTTLIIRDTHNRTLHVGPHIPLSTTRRTFWIVNGSNALRGFIRKCVTCLDLQPDVAIARNCTLIRALILWV